MKRKIRFEFEGERYEVTVERTGDQLALTHEGKRYSVSLLEEEAEGGGAGQQTPAGSAAPVVPAAQVASPQPQVPAAAAPPAGGGAAGALPAPMTGVVKDIKVGVGHQVQQGQVVLVMEAMKMDIDVPSPVTGIVAEVSVNAGDNVNANQQLMIIQ